ncbi:MAG: glycine betaine ABC transporter substrate-binding protein [Actinomycetota bacterium]
MRNPQSVRGAITGLVIAVFALSACGGDDAFDSSAGSSSGTKKELVVGGPTFTEAAIMQNMYAQVLQKAGFTVQLKAVGERPIYTEALKSGEIDIVPDYLATTVNKLNGSQVSSPDADATYAELQKIGKSLGIGALQPAKALNTNAFYVTKEFAAANGGLTSLSELAATGKTIRLGAPADCTQNPFCLGDPGLKGVYGLRVAEPVQKYDFGSPAMAKAVRDGVVDVGESGTTDGTLAKNGFVVLADDKKLQHADNLLPVINLKDASDPKIAEALNKLSAILTTEDLTGLNAQVDVERRKPADVAREYLTAKGLL